MSWRKTVVPLIVVGIVAMLFAIGANAATPGQAQVKYPVKFGVSPPMKSLPTVPRLSPRAQFGERPNQLHLFPARPPVTDTVVQRTFGLTNMPTPTTSFDGIGATGYTPPDTEGAVGGNSPASNVYVQWINTSWAVFSKTTGAMIAGPFPGNSFWSGFGGNCQSDNNGDPIVLYDKLADRWFVAQFSLTGGPYYQCLAVSTSPDPTGTYFQYAYATGGVFPDYPKYSIWSDAYLGTWNEFGSESGVGVLIMQRAKMLTGDPTAAMILFDNNGLNWWSMLPADFDGTIAPPAGTAVFGQVAHAGTAVGQTQDSFLIWNATYDWANPGAACFGASCSFQPNYILPVAGYNDICPGNRACVPEPAGGESLDAISGYTMYRLQWRNTGDTEHLVANHTVDGGGYTGIRWYEMQGGVASGWSLFQQGTLAPGDGLWRWMGSIAMDHSGDIAVGYSGSNSSTFPGVYYSGRLVGDPFGTLPQAEGQLVAGTGVINTGYNRWGDYSAMQIDPTDDCTFWYTQEYAGNGGWNWFTRIGSFKFPSCSIGPTGTLTGAVTNANNGNPIGGALVTAGAASTLTNGSGIYNFTLPVGTYDMSASRFGYAPGSATGISVTEGGTTTQNFALQPVGSASVDGYVTDFGHGWPLYAQIVITATGAPTTTIYTDPFNGYYDVVLVNGYDYNFAVTALTPGYDPQSRVVSVSGTDQTQNFMLVPTSPSCSVLGYGPPITGFGETFDEVAAPALPSNWQSVIVADPYGQSPAWQTSNGTVWWGTPAHSLPNAAGSNNYNYLAGEQMRLQMTTDVNMATVTPPQLSYWFYETSGYCSFTSGGVVQPQISIDGGSTWTDIGNANNSCNSNSGWVQYTVDLSSYTGEATVRIGFLNTSDWWNATNIDDVLLGAPGPCTPKNGALVAGFVTDANTNTGLVGAKVANDLGGSTHTVNDANLGAGFYSFFTPTPPFDGPSLRTFTASMAKYANGTVQEVLTPNTVNRLDFALGAGWLELNPTSLWSRLYPGQTEDQFLTLTNMGNLAANYKLSATEIKTTWPHMSWVKPGPPHVKVASTARARTAGHPAGKPANVPQLAGAPAFGVNLNAATFYTWPDVTAPGTWTQIASEPGSSYFGGTFLSGDLSKEYVVDYAANTLSTLDTTTGAATVIGPAVPGAGESWTGLTGAPDGTMYGAATTCSSSTLYTVDPTTGATTAVGPISNGPCIIDIAANSAGDLYGVDIVNDTLVKIDPTTGAGTVIGPTGVNANYAQGLAFDQTTDTLYWAAYTTGGELRVIDTATGASTLIGAFPGGAEVDALSIATFAGTSSLPWLTLTPTEGSVAPAASSQVDAQFIADGADHFGLFRAKIKTSTDTPYSVNDVSVCFSKAFLDVPAGYWADAQINAIAGARITTGCGVGNFCPDNVMTRGTMARWLLLARHGNLYAPPPCTGIFADVPCETTPNAAYIEEFYNEGITAGCATDPLRYCPDSPVTRAQMSVFIMKASQAPGYLPPDCAGLFADVACPGGFAVKWIEDLYNHQITAGCGTNPLIFCPDNSTTRAQEAVFVDKAWSIVKCPAPLPPTQPTK